MAISTQPTEGRWSSRWLFVLAAAGSAVGLGQHLEVPVYRWRERRWCVRTYLSGLCRLCWRADHDFRGDVGA